MSDRSNGITPNRPTVEDLCGWLSADGSFSPRITDAEMARLLELLAIDLATRLRRRYDLNPVAREDAIEAAHGAASHLGHVRTLAERQNAVTAEAMEHRYEPVVAPYSHRQRGVDLGDDPALLAETA